MGRVSIQDLSRDSQQEIDKIFNNGCSYKAVVDSPALAVPEFAISH